MSLLVRAGAAAAVLAALAGPAAAASNVVQCTLHHAGPTEPSFAGTCAVPCLVNDLLIDIDGPKPGATCTAPPREVPITLAPTGQPGHWLGRMDGKFPEDPKRVELTEPTAGHPGIAKTPFGWFPLTSDTTDAGTMHLQVAASAQLPPTANDTAILQRALSLLPDDAAWNRHDTRTCPAGAPTHSLFCALQESATAVTGGVHYRQPALQAAREAVDAAYTGQIGKHRLMEFNNDPATTLAQVRLVLQAAEATLRTRLR